MPSVRVLLAALPLLLVACGGSSAAAACEERIPGVRPGLCPIPVEDREPAPTEAVQVLGSEDEELSLADLRGRVSRAVDQAGSDVETLQDGLSAAYREW